MYLDGHFRVNDGWTIGDRIFRVIIKEHISLTHIAGRCIGFPVWPFTESARHSSGGRELYIDLAKIEEEDCGDVVLVEVLEWCRDYPGWAVSINRSWQEPPEH